LKKPQVSRKNPKSQSAIYPLSTPITTNDSVAS
jgi:hypothetical protein